MEKKEEETRRKRPASTMFPLAVRPVSGKGELVSRKR